MIFAGRHARRRMLPMRSGSIVFSGAFATAASTCAAAYLCERRRSSARCDAAGCSAVHMRDLHRLAPPAPAMMLASSPSPPIMHAAQIGDMSIEQPKHDARRWRSIKWWASGSRALQKRWWKRMRQTFFVVVRGTEVVVRLSPLIILTPTAVIVSYVDPIWRTFIRSVGLGERPNDLTPLLTIEGLGPDQGEGDMYAKQFQDSSERYAQHRNSSTWASNLAWRYTLHTLQSLGPAFVKLGQWAATRRDLFPVHMCNRLSELHDTARIHEWRYTQQALVEAFGEDYESLGLVVDRGAILGSGSAAQVHRGTLTTHARTGSKTNNTQLKTRDVAIKVLHPNTRVLVQRDLALMQHIADFIDTCVPLEIVKMLSLPRAVATFSQAMQRQVDLMIEGTNLQIFRDNFGCLGHYDDAPSPPAITFPLPETGWISERVLVEEHFAALPISKFLADDSPEGLKTRKRLAGPLLRAFLKMVFIDNFIHADLHPGNVLVKAVPNKANPKRTNYTIVFLDAGIATSLRPNDKKNLHDLFKAVVLNDGYTAGSLMVERARYEKCTSIPGGKDAFATGVANIVEEFHDRRKQGLTLGAVRVGALLGQVLDLCRRYGVEIDPAMSSVVVSMLVLEGLGRSLDPDLNLMKAAVPFLLGRGKV